MHASTPGSFLPESSQTSTSHPLSYVPTLTCAVGSLAPAGAQQRAPETPASPAFLESISESWGLFGRRKSNLDNGLAAKGWARGMARRGHASKFDLICFGKISWVSTGKHLHRLALSGPAYACALGPYQGAEGLAGELPLPLAPQLPLWFLSTSSGCGCPPGSAP